MHRLLYFHFSKNHFDTITRPLYLQKSVPCFQLHKQICKNCQTFAVVLHTSIRVRLSTKLLSNPATVFTEKPQRILKQLFLFKTIGSSSKMIHQKTTVYVIPDTFT